MRVLVTGATGFTGGHLTTHLARAGERVRVLVRAGRRPRVPEDVAIDVVEGDLTDAASLRRALDGVDVAYNIAALYREAGLPADAYRAVNADAVRALILAARDAGTRRLVHCSTVGVHGDIEHPPANEDAPLRPGDVFQETKVLGERLAREAAAETGVELVIARPTGIYGPGDRRLFKLFGAVARGRFVMLGSGRNFYHLTYVTDLCEGFRLCGTVPAAAGRTYILGGGEVTTLADLVAITREVAGRGGVRLRLPVWPVWVAGALCEAACAPFGIAPAELGYAPRTGVREGIRLTLEWYREQGWI
jgi:nucleoside-diphosphate-sugar epimerase